MSIVEEAVNLLASAQVEIIIFLIAFVAHSLVFGQHPFVSRKVKGGPPLTQLEKSRQCSPPPSPTAARTSPAASPVVLKPLQGLVRSGATSEAFRRELLRTLSARGSPDGPADVLATILSQLGKGVTHELLAAARSVLQELGVEPTGRLFEALLHGYLYLGMREDFDKLLVEVRAKDVLPQLTISIIALRASIVSKDIESALQNVPEVAAAWHLDASSTPSLAYSKIFQQLVRLAMDTSCFPRLCGEMQRNGIIKPWTIEALLTECKSGQSEERRLIRDLASKEKVVYTAGAHAALVRCANDGEEAYQAFQDGLAAGAAGKFLLLAASSAALEHRHKMLAETATKIAPSHLDKEVSAAMLGLCVSNGPLAGDDPDAAVLQLYTDCISHMSHVGELSVERTVTHAALRRQDRDALNCVLAKLDDASRVALLKSVASEHRLKYVFDFFEACPDKNTVLLNAFLDACIDARDYAACARVMRMATEDSMADIVTYNTMVKAHLQNGNFSGARSTVKAMGAAGIAPNCITFNALIDASIREHGQDVWALVSEMRARGLRPNHVTCSILLKSIHRASKASDVEKVLAVLEDMDEAMDEVLLSSVCEACIRSGCSDLLSRQLKQQKATCTQVKGAHTYGSIIRAYGFINDVDGVWTVWGEMQSRHVVPTSVTLGCMVEALASNGDPEAGYVLIREFMDSPQRRALVNAVIYCSVLKGLSHQKQFDRVWAIYDEMKAENLQFSIVTYNALIDACSRSADMGRIPALLEEMAAVKIEPNIITYSTVIKGYCQVDSVDRAFELLREMKNCRGLHPDEVTYNTLLDGCARYGKWDQGITLLEEMQDTGVSPSNFTLSVLVKLANRSRRPEKAFQLTEDLCAKYNLRLNVHVFNNLIHVCTAMNDLPRAYQIVERMLTEKVRPDARTYLLLIRGCIRQKVPADAAGFLRAAGGLSGAHHLFKNRAHMAQPKGGLPMDTVSEALEGISRSCNDETLAAQLLRDLRDVPGLPLDQRLPLRLASRTRRP